MLVAFGLMLVGACVAPAQDPGTENRPSLSTSRYPIIIRDARVGLPPGKLVGERDDNGRAANLAKNNTWAPVYIWLEIAKEVRKDAAIVVEASDTDDLTDRTHVLLQNLTAELPGTRLQPTELRFIPYIRPGGRGNITVSIRVPERDTDPGRWSLLSEPFKLNYVRTRDVAKYFVLGLGSKLQGFSLPGSTEQDDGQQGSKALRNGRIETGEITNPAELPDQWYGYDAADLVVLGTGTDEKFIAALFTDPTYKTRLDALLEWVRRGGRLVISVGRNAQIVAQHPVLQDLLPGTIQRDDPAVQVTKLPLRWDVRGVAASTLTSRNNNPFSVANVTPKSDRGVRILLPSDRARTADDQLVVLQSQFGLGRVTMTTIDLDRSPFADSASRDVFWDVLLREAGAAKASVGAPNARTGSSITWSGGQFFTENSEDELAGSLRGYIDHFDGVPVISFGWVAVFIILYTLLIGPIEYYFLKKVLKRLELTWITFPIIVLTVSAIAYFTAYAIKGKDLKLNKIDVVDVDPASGRVYGRMWLTVFSPRIDTYRVGIEPNAGWATASTPESPTTGALVDWFGGNRTGRESLFRRSYYYRLEPPGGVNRNPWNNGLIDVPIPVWSTKAFTADWSANIDGTMVVSNLVHPPADASNVVGEFTLNLPFDEIPNAYLLYAGRAYQLDAPIRPGQPLALNVLLREPDPDWLSKIGANSNLSVAPQTTQVARSNANSAKASNMAEMLFHEKALDSTTNAAPYNSTLRRLDQSHRLSVNHRDEVILVARLPTVRGGTEEVLTSPNSASPTRLWLNELPGEGRERTPILGTLQQDTYLRVFIPIRKR